MKNNIIPIFFSADDNYIPFLDVSIRSLIEHASKEYKYKIIVLNAGLNQENMNKVKLLENENVQIEFVNISKATKSLEQDLPNLYHFGLAAWYRLFIQSLFPQYDRVIYLDCDIVVLGDISELYNMDLHGNTIGGCKDQIIPRTPEFADYARFAVGIDANEYINSGILVMDLKKFREQQIEEKFIHIMNKYNCDIVDPDQAYINFLCKDKIEYLPISWNRPAFEMVECENPKIIHYNLFVKPWQDDSIFLGEYFWNYAKQSPFYEQIKHVRNSFDDEARAKKVVANQRLVEHAVKLLKSNNTFAKIFANQNVQEVIWKELSEEKEFIFKSLKQKVRV